MTTPERSVEEIVEEFAVRYEKTFDDHGEQYEMYNPKAAIKDLQDWLTQTLKAERQKREEVADAAEAREKQLRTVHTMELDAVSCMSIEDFVVWRDHRKQRLT